MDPLECRVYKIVNLAINSKSLIDLGARRPEDLMCMCVCAEYHIRQLNRCATKFAEQIGMTQMSILFHI